MAPFPSEKERERNRLGRHDDCGIRQPSFKNYCAAVARSRRLCPEEPGEEGILTGRGSENVLFPDKDLGLLGWARGFDWAEYKGDGLA